MSEVNGRSENLSLTYCGSKHDPSKNPIIFPIPTFSPRKSSPLDSPRSERPRARSAVMPWAASRSRTLEAVLEHFC